MTRYIITRTYEVERTFVVEAPSEAQALADSSKWEEVEEITRDVLSTDIQEDEERDDE